MSKIITLTATKEGERKVHIDLKIHGDNDDFTAIKVLSNAIQQILDKHESNLTLQFVEK